MWYGYVKIMTENNGEHLRGRRRKPRIQEIKFMNESSLSNAKCKARKHWEVDIYIIDTDVDIFETKKIKYFTAEKCQTIF